MPSTTAVKSVRTLIAGSTSNAAGATTRGTVDLRTAMGAILTARLTNGGTGPTVQAVVNVLIAHNAGATPTAGSQGADWKLLTSFGGGTVASTVTEQAVFIDPSVMHVCVEVTGNTGQAVTCEAILSEFTRTDTV
jgi:hypothetical protein